MMAFFCWVRLNNGKNGYKNASQMRYDIARRFLGKQAAERQSVNSIFNLNIGQTSKNAQTRSAHNSKAHKERAKRRAPREMYDFTINHFWM